MRARTADSDGRGSSKGPLEEKRRTIVIEATRATAHNSAMTEAGPNDRWVFGYGSLMWRPGFPHAERVRAVLHGRRRAFCIYSVYHRGVPEAPGLVLGLAPGGSVRGVAFRVAASD